MNNTYINLYPKIGWKEVFLYFQDNRVSYNKENYTSVFTEKPLEVDRIKASEAEHSLSYW